jgi:hypothetical protein
MSESKNVNGAGYRQLQPILRPSWASMKSFSASDISRLLNETAPTSRQRGMGRGRSGCSGWPASRDDSNIRHPLWFRW